MEKEQLIREALTEIIRLSTMSNLAEGRVFNNITELASSALDILDGRYQ